MKRKTLDGGPNTSSIHHQQQLVNRENFFILLIFFHHRNSLVTVVIVIVLYHNNLVVIHVVAIVIRYFSAIIINLHKLIIQCTMYCCHCRCVGFFLYLLLLLWVRLALWGETCVEKIYTVYFIKRERGRVKKRIILYV